MNFGVNSTLPRDHIKGVGGLQHQEIGVASSLFRDTGAVSNGVKTLLDEALKKIPF